MFLPIHCLRCPPCPGVIRCVQVRCHHPADVSILWRLSTSCLSPQRRCHPASLSPPPSQVWPSDRSKTQECKRRLFELYDQGKLQVWVDDSAAFKGVASIPQAVDHMLSGKCVGKVVVDLRD